jgi:hypothetical protein
MRLQVDPGWNERRRTDLSCQSEQNGYLSPDMGRIDDEPSISCGLFCMAEEDE